MTKYTVASQRRVTARLNQTYAIWRGIGCILVLVVPILCWILAVETVQIAVDRAWPMPYQLMGNPVMPNLLWQVSFLTPALAFIQAQTNLYAILAITVAYVVVASALMALGYAIAYRIVGPPRYGPLDAPPPKIRAERYKR